MNRTDERRFISRAACAVYPADWWFPEDPDPFELGRVRNVCLSCPVRRECLDYGVEMDRTDKRVQHGVYAGLTDSQRSSLRRGVCVGCRRREDPALLWARVGNWRPTGCRACDALRTGHLAAQRRREQERRAAEPVPLPFDVIEADSEWWSRQRAAAGSSSLR